MISQLYPVISRPTVDFIEALGAAGGALTPPYVGSAVYPLYGLPGAGNRRFLIRAIRYVCVQRVGLEIDFFSGPTTGAAAVATSNFISRYSFISVNGNQYNGAGVYEFYVDGLAIPYYNLSDGYQGIAAPAMYVGVQNVDTVAKSAAAAGAIAMTIWAQPMESVQG